METEPNEPEVEEENEKEEVKIEFLLVQDIDLGEPHAPIITPPIEEFLKIVLGKLKEKPNQPQPVLVRIQGFTEKEINPTLGYMAELFFYSGAFIYRGTLTIKEETISDLGELFLVTLEANATFDGSRCVFI